jgi:hypothetical protein
VDKTGPALNENRRNMNENTDNSKPEDVDRTTPTAAQFGSYERAFEYFNKEIFGGKLPACILNLSRHGKCYGFFAAGQWEHDDQRQHEISLNPKHLKRDRKDIASTLVHEMVHLWQQVFGKPGRRGYHNKEWGSEMERIGLMPSSTGAPGGKRTGSSMSHYVIEGGAFGRAFERMPDDCLLPWVTSEPTKPAKPREDKVKFTCPQCGVNAWGKATLDIICHDCMVGMERPLETLRGFFGPDRILGDLVDALRGFLSPADRVALFRREYGRAVADEDAARAEAAE